MECAETQPAAPDNNTGRLNSRHHLISLPLPEEPAIAAHKYAFFYMAQSAKRFVDAASVSISSLVPSCVVVIMKIIELLDIGGDILI